MSDRKRESELVRKYLRDPRWEGSPMAEWAVEKARRQREQQWHQVLLALLLIVFVGVPFLLFLAVFVGTVLFGVP